MSLRTKTFLITAIPLLVSLLILYAVVSGIIRLRFADIEERSARMNADRVVAVINSQSAEMERLAADWGRWDSTYGFMGKENPDFLRELIDDTFDTLKINLIVITGTEGKISFSKGFDLAAGKEVPPPEEFAGELPRDSVLVRGIEKPVSGVVLTSAGPMFIGVNPVLTNDGTGPSRGSIAMGRIMSASLAQRMLGVVRTPFEMVPLAGEALPAALEAPARAMLSGDSFFFEEAGESSIAAYARVDDVYGKPALLVRVLLPRDITEYGEITVKYVTFALAGMGGALILLTQLILGRFVVTRLSRVSQAAVEIGQASDFSRRVPGSGSDELGKLVESVNGMLSRLERANEQVVRAQRVREEFTATVSHDLRAPLATVKEGVGVVFDGIDGPINEKQRATLDIVRRNIERMSRLITNVLDLSRIESGNLHVSFEETDMNSLVGEVFESMRFAAEKKGLLFSKSLPAEPLSVCCDPERIKQLLVNLVDNAVKFTDRGSVEIRLAPLEGGARIEVADTGVGVAIDEQESIFERFRQARTGRSRRSKGAGLGLAISRHIVERHGGRIHVESTEGKGSTFIIELPADPPEPQSKS